jgi:hypothetical protein
LRNAIVFFSHSSTEAIRSIFTIRRFATFALGPLRERQAKPVKAADFLLRDGNFPLVILDLVLNTMDELRRIPATNWYRLQRLVEPTPTAFVVISRHNMVASARTKIVLENRWSLSDLSRDHPSTQLHFKVRRAKAIASAIG